MHANAQKGCKGHRQSVTLKLVESKRNLIQSICPQTVALELANIYNRETTTTTTTTTKNTITFTNTFIYNYTNTTLRLSRAENIFPKLYRG